MRGRSRSSHSVNGVVDACIVPRSCVLHPFSCTRRMWIVTRGRTSRAAAQHQRLPVCNTFSTSHPASYFKATFRLTVMLTKKKTFRVPLFINHPCRQMLQQAEEVPEGEKL